MRVLVVGAGVVGLSAAVCLAERGADVHVVARDLPLETTSAVAAAWWYPYRALPQDRVTAWAGRSYQTFAALAGRSGTGVVIRQGFEVHRSAQPDPWWLDAVPKLRRLDILSAGYADGWAFEGPVVEMPLYLGHLRQRLAAAGGSLTRLALSALPTGADAVVNCAGLAARWLVGDDALVPVRGQVVRLAQVGLADVWLDASGPQPTYVVPRSHDIVVGGTDDEGSWDRRPDPAVARDILARAVALVPQLAPAAVVGHRVGLRPGRPTVRLEREERPGGSPVVHCYGHGGAGVTLSWGCAQEVTELVLGPQNSRSRSSSTSRNAS